MKSLHVYIALLVLVIAAACKKEEAQPVNTPAPVARKYPVVYGFSYAGELSPITQYRNGIQIDAPEHPTATSPLLTTVEAETDAEPKYTDVTITLLDAKMAAISNPTLRIIDTVEYTATDTSFYTGTYYLKTNAEGGYSTVWLAVAKDKVVERYNFYRGDLKGLSAGEFANNVGRKDDTVSVRTYRCNFIVRK
ncbi:MAG: hypothetical protein V4616_09990 [Bacteroidota bacterium]